MSLRRHATTLVLVAVAALLAVVVLVLDRRTVGTDEAEQRALNLFDAWREAEITRVAVRHGGQERVLSRAPSAGADPAAWSLAVDGLPAAADPMAVLDFLSAVELARFERPVSVDDRATLGLDPPHLQIDVAMGALDYRLEVGAEAPSPPGARYAEVRGGSRGERTYVVTAELVTALKTRSEELRARKLVPFTSSVVRGVTVAALPSDEVRWRLRRGGGEGNAAVFMLEGPGGAIRASSAAVDSFFGAVGRLEAERFLAPDTDHAAPTLRLSFEPRDEATPAHTLQLGGPCEGGGVMVSRTAPQPVVACASEAAATDLDVPASALADHRVVGASGPQITEVKLTRGERLVDVARKGAGWTMRAPTDGSADADAVDRWVDDLLALEGTVVADADRTDLAALGLDAPAATLRVISLPRHGADAGEERVESIDVGALRGEQVYVYRHEDATILRLDLERARPLEAGATALRSLVVTDVPARQVRGLRVTGCVEGVKGKDQRRQHLTRNRAGTWKLVEPAGEALEADPALATGLSLAIAQLRAVRWVADASDERFGLAEPWCVVELEHEPPVGGSEDDTPRERIRIALGGRTDGGHYAQRDGEGAVFLAPPATATAAGRWLLDRAGMLLPMDQVTRVVVTAGERSLTVERDGNRWLLAGDDPVAHRERVGQAVRELLEGLVAEEVVRRGDPTTEHGLSSPAVSFEVHLRPPAEPVVIRVGAGDVLGSTRVRYLQREGVPLVYAVAESRLQGVLELF